MTRVSNCVCARAHIYIYIYIYIYIFTTCLGDLRRVSADVRLLGMLVRILPGSWMSLVAVVSSVVETSALG
jgi:hypothetical protein